MDKGTYLYSERRLADYLDLPRKMFADARDRLLTHEQDWKNRGGEIVLTLKGTLRLLQAFEIPESEVDLTKCFILSPQEKNGAPLLLMAPGAAPTPVKMRVRTIYMNPRLLEAQEVGRMALYRVIVQSNFNFIVGMEFMAVPDEANPGFWRVHGNLPRWKGRW